VTWIQATAAAGFEAAMNPNGFVMNNRMSVLQGNCLWSSLDGATWTHTGGAMAFSPRLESQAVVYDDKMWLIGGYSSAGELNDVWSSTNGVSWNRVTSAAAFSPRRNHASVVYNGKMWVIGGFKSTDFYSDVWSSNDGATWDRAVQSANFPQRASHTSLVFNDRMWILAGETFSFSVFNVLPLDDVWYSTDGIAWKLAVWEAPFEPRRYHSSVVFDNRMWVIGGRTTQVKNDVWYSSDGATWTCATEAAAFSPRRDHTTIAYNGKMYLFGGLDATGYLNDVWSSSDGITWTQITAAAAFAPRQSHAGLVFENKLWVLYGHDGNFRNDVWFSGTGCHPHLTPATLSFGEQDITAGAAGPRTVTLSNLYPDAWEPLTITGVQVQNQTGRVFAFTSEPDTRKLLAGDSRDFSLLFDPSTPGLKTAQLVITGDDPMNPVFTIPVSGTATGTGVESPAGLIFY
jgi:hypothetical protein